MNKISQGKTMANARKHHPKQNNVAERLKHAREILLCQSVTEFAQVMGVTAAAVYAWESGRRAVPHGILHQLETEHGISTSWITNGTEPQRVPYKVGHSAPKEQPSFMDKINSARMHMRDALKTIEAISPESLRTFAESTAAIHKFPRLLSGASAGSAVELSDDTDTVDIVDFLIENPQETFFMNVNGDSMNGAGLFHGDLLIIDKSVPAISGHIVIARIFGEVTVKRYIRKGKATILQAENPKFKDIEIAPDTDFEILGVVRHCVRVL